MEDFCDDPVQVYLREVAVAPLTQEQEADCEQHVRAGDLEAGRAGRDLIEASMAIVVEIANALVHALKTFRDSHEESFSAHARVCVERAIARATATLES